MQIEEYQKTPDSNNDQSQPENNEKLDNSKIIIKERKNRGKTHASAKNNSENKGKNKKKEGLVDIRD